MESGNYADTAASHTKASSNQLQQVLQTGNNPQVRNIAEIIQRIRPDIILLNEFDYIKDPQQGILAFNNNYLNVSQNQHVPIDYRFYFVAPVNTGVRSPFDLDNDGKTTGIAADAWGYGLYPGHYGMAVLSRYPIDNDKVRTLQTFRWQDMPHALAPTIGGEPWYEADEWAALRLSSKSVWDVPIVVNGNTIHVIASHPTPPVFDGEEDRNGKRNHDEIRLLADYISGASYVYDDTGQNGGLAQGARFVIVGDLNADANGGDSHPNAIAQLLNHPLVNSNITPRNSANDVATSSWGLRVDYVLPSTYGFTPLGAGIFAPISTEAGFNLVRDRASSSDHRLVWVDLALDD